MGNSPLFRLPHCNSKLTNRIKFRCFHNINLSQHTRQDNILLAPPLHPKKSKKKKPEASVTEGVMFPLTVKLPGKNAQA